MPSGAGGPSFTSACGKVPVINLGIPARWKVSWEWGGEETGTRWQTGTTPHTARIRLCLYALWVAGIHSLPGPAVRLPSVNCHRAGLKRCVRALSVQVFAVCCLCSKSWVGLGVGQILDAQTREWRLRPRDTMRVACTACRRTAGNPPKLLQRLHSCKHSRPCTGRCSSCPELTSMCEVAAVCPGLHWRSKARQAGCQGIALQRAVKTRWRGGVRYHMPFMLGYHTPRECFTCALAARVLLQTSEAVFWCSRRLALCTASTPVRGLWQLPPLLQQMWREASGGSGLCVRD